MKKLLKKLSILLIAALCTVCVAAFVACGDDNGDEFATDKIYITVLDENGNAIDGTTFGVDKYDEENHQVQIQFCTLGGGCTMNNPNVGTDGKAVFNLSDVKDLAQSGNTDTVELHVLGVEEKGYEYAYGQYKVSEIPKNVTITLKKA